MQKVLAGFVITCCLFTVTSYLYAGEPNKEVNLRRREK